MNAFHTLHKYSNVSVLGESQLCYSKYVKTTTLTKEHALSHCLNTQLNNCFHGDDYNNTDCCKKKKDIPQLQCCSELFFLSFPFLFFRPRLHSFFLSLSFSPFSFSVLLQNPLLFALVLAGGVKTEIQTHKNSMWDNVRHKVSQPSTVQYSVSLIGQLLCIFSMSLCLFDNPLPFCMATEEPEEVR